MAKGMLGSMIAKYRKEAGMTQEELGNKVGVSTQAVSRWECGGTPDVELLPAIADCLRVSVDALFGREVTKTADLKELAALKIKNAPKEECMELLLDYILKLQIAAQINFLPEVENTFDMLPICVRDRSGEDNPKHLPSEYIWNDDRCCMRYGLVEDRRFAVVITEPEKGFASTLKNTEEYVRLFELLSKPHCLEMLVDINRRNPEEYFTVRSAATRLNISEEEAGAVLEELYLNVMLDRMEIMDENGALEVYCIKTPVDLYPFLFFCETVMQSVDSIHLTVNGRKTPVFKEKPGTDSLTPTWDIREEGKEKIEKYSGKVG